MNRNQINRRKFLHYSAAGVAAALAARKKTTPQKVSLKKIKEILVGNGAIAPGV